MITPRFALPPFTPEWIDLIARHPSVLRAWWDDAEAISPFAPYCRESALISPPPLEITPFDAATDDVGSPPFVEGA